MTVFCCLHVGLRGVGWEGAAQSAPELPEVPVVDRAT